MIVFEHLTKHRGTRTVLDDASFEARRGRVTAFLGPNGAGKSSSLRALLGLERPDGDRALVDGRPYRRLREPLRTVGSMLDGSGAHRARTGRAHLSWLATSNGIDRARVDRVLEQVGLADAARKRVGDYSIGMGQRLGFAAALLGEPVALVLDEPVNGLDPEGIRWMRGLLREQASEGRAVLLSSHLMGEVADVADVLVVIAHGRVVASGAVSEVASGYRTLESAFFGLTGGEAL